MGHCSIDSGKGSNKEEEAEDGTAVAGLVHQQTEVGSHSATSAVTFASQKEEDCWPVVVGFQQGL